MDVVSTASAHDRTTDTHRSQRLTAAGRPQQPAQAVLVTVRFGEYLRDQLLLSDEQWLACLAAHWSEEPRRRFGDTVVSQGYLSVDAVERAAAEFHDGLDVVAISSSRRGGSEPGFD
jgi:hypothetical protein